MTFSPRFLSSALCALLLASAPLRAQEHNCADHASTPLSRLDALLARAGDKETLEMDCQLIPTKALRAYRDRLAAGNSNGHAAYSWARLWPGGNVYYSFDASMTLEKRALFEAACREWETVARLKFIPRTTQTNYILVKQTANTSNSFVGMTGNAQVMNLANWASQYTAAHELAHALGIMHEHQRSDRDGYVSINYQNITAGTEHNFDIIDGSLNQGIYDFDSVMHYFGTAFSSNGGITIQAKPTYASQQNLMGQRDHLSLIDKSGMRALYGAPIGNYSVSGQVFYLNGALTPVAKVGIPAVTVRLNSTTTTLTDSSGNYSFSNVAPGPYTLSATKNSQQYSPATRAVTVTDASVSNVNFKTYQVEGQVFRFATDGVTRIPLSNVPIKINNVVRTTTDSSGNYRVRGLVGTVSVKPVITDGFTFTAKTAVFPTAGVAGISPNARLNFRPNNAKPTPETSKKSS